jgi:hypothetical protein
MVRFLRQIIQIDVLIHYCPVFTGDGCLMEGVASEAASLAGHLQLGNLIYVRLEFIYEFFFPLICVFCRSTMTIVCNIFFAHKNDTK